MIMQYWIFWLREMKLSLYRYSFPKYSEILEIALVFFRAFYGAATGYPLSLRWYGPVLF